MYKDKIWVRLRLMMIGITGRIYIGSSSMYSNTSSSDLRQKIGSRDYSRPIARAPIVAVNPARKRKGSSNSKYMKQKDFRPVQI